MKQIISISKAGNSGQPLSAKMLNEDLLSYGVKVHQAKISDTKKSILHRILVCVRLWRFIINHPQFIIIIHLNLEALFLQLFPWKNVLFVNHGIYNYADRRSILRFFNLCILNWSARIVKNWVFFVNGIHAQASGSSNILPNRIDSNGLEKRLKTHNEAFPLKNIGFVGRNDFQKNLIVLSPLILKNPDLQFYHLGPDPIDEFLHFSNYHHLNSTNRTYFFKTIDLLLIPSRYESFGLVAYEAAHCNIPVVHSGQDGLASYKVGYNLDSADWKVWSNLKFSALNPNLFFMVDDGSGQALRQSAIEEILSIVNNFDHNSSF